MRLLTSFVDRLIIGLDSWAASEMTLVAHCLMVIECRSGWQWKQKCDGDAYPYPRPTRPVPETVGAVASSRYRQQNSKTQKTDGIAVAKND